MGYGRCVVGSGVGVLVGLLPAVVLLLPGENADNWLVRPGVALMLGAVLGCWIALRLGGYRRAGVTGLALAGVLAGLYWPMVFVSGDEGVSMVGVFVVPVLSPLLSPLARVIALPLGDLLRGGLARAGGGGR